MKLVLFDLDDTLFDGDTEGEWVKFMDQNGFITDNLFFERMEVLQIVIKGESWMSSNIQSFF